MAKVNTGVAAFNYDDLLASTDAKTLPAIAKDTVLLRGTIVALGEEGIVPIADAEDGKVYGIAAEDVDATEEKAHTVVYVAGTFNRDALVTGGEKKVEELETEMRDIGLFIRDTY